MRLVLFGITREHCRGCACEVPAEELPLCEECLRVETMTLYGPYEKGSGSYLSPGDWHGASVPLGQIGPWGLGQTCWWYLTKDRHGGRRVFAAEDAPRALAAAREVAAAEGYELLLQPLA